MSNSTSNLIRDLYSIVRKLEHSYPGRPFTPDGHLVGSIGECLVAEKYELKLEKPSNQGFDATDASGRRIEIKTTQAKRVAFRSCPDFCIVVRLNQDGSIEEFYNGPGRPIWSQFEFKTRPSNGQFGIGLATLRKLSKAVERKDQIARLRND